MKKDTSRYLHRGTFSLREKHQFVIVVCATLHQFNGMAMYGGCDFTKSKFKWTGKHRCLFLVSSAAKELVSTCIFQPRRCPRLVSLKTRWRANLWWKIKHHQTPVNTQQTASPRLKARRRKWSWLAANTGRSTSCCRAVFLMAAQSLSVL